MFAKTAILLATAAAVLAQSNPPTINSPLSLTQCQPVLLQWQGGSGEPYYISALPGQQTTASPLKDFGMQTGNSLTWNVDLPVGTSISLRVIDSQGVSNYAAAVTIMAGQSTSCLTSNSSSSASGTSAAAASGSSATGSAASAGSSTKSASSSSSGTAAAAAASASKSGAASPAFALHGGLIAVAAGAVGAALF